MIMPSISKRKPFKSEPSNGSKKRMYNPNKRRQIQPNRTPTANSRKKKTQRKGKVQVYTIPKFLVLKHPNEKKKRFVIIKKRAYVCSFPNNTLFKDGSLKKSIYVDVKGEEVPVFKSGFFKKIFLKAKQIYRSPYVNSLLKSSSSVAINGSQVYITMCSNQATVKGVKCFNATCPKDPYDILSVKLSMYTMLYTDILISRYTKETPTSHSDGFKFSKAVDAVLSGIGYKFKNAQGISIIRKKHKISETYSNKPIVKGKKKRKQQNEERKRN